jgi:hypothetical protein
MTDGAAPGARNLRCFVVEITSSALRLRSCQACGKSDGRTRGFNSAVAAKPLTPAPNRAGTRSRPNPREPRADFGLFARSNGYPDW